MQKNDYWKTPEDLLKTLKYTFTDNGGFLDVCPDQKEYEKFISGDYEGLFDGFNGSDALDPELPWGDDYTELAFVNPPYSGNYKERSIGRAVEVNNTEGFPVACLFPASVETAWFKEIEEKSTLVWYLGKRVSFADPVTGKPGTGNRSGSVIFILDKYRKVVNKQSVETLCKDNPYGGYGYYRSEEASNVGYHFRVSS